MALSSKERTAKHRLKKQATEFIDKYLEGKQIASIKEFIEAKKYEFECSNIVASVSFDQGFINRFFERAADLDQYDDNHCDSIDLFFEWNDLEKEANM